MSHNLVMRKNSIIFLLLLIISLLGATVAPLAVQAAPVAVADPETVYIVQHGDTLSALARRYGVTLQALLAYNTLSSTNIYVGQRLLIPGQSTPTYPITYVVQRGDTLSKIAKRYDTTVAALMQVNNLRTETIYVGQRLTISVASDPNQPLIYYTVQRGDSLSAIARRYTVSVAAVRAANGLTNDTIYVGQRLLIPNSLGYPTPTPAPAPGRERIQFAAGATATTVRGTVQLPNRREYLLRALGGQTMRVELISSDASANFAVTGVSDGQPLKRLENRDTVWSGALPSTQDYLLQVTTPNHYAVSYELYVEVTGPTTRTPVRIQFAPGATAATVNGLTSAIEPARYLLRANAGQTMYVDDDEAGFAFDYHTPAWTMGEKLQIGSRSYVVQMTFAAHAPEETGATYLEAAVMTWDPKDDLAAYVAVRKQAWTASGMSIVDEEARTLAGGHPAMRFLVNGADGANQGFFLITTVGEQYLVLSGAGKVAALEEVAQTLRVQTP